MAFNLVRDIKFYASLAYISVAHSLGLQNWYDRITDKIVLGALPILPDFDSTIARERITHVISMVEPHEIKGFVLGPHEAAIRGLSYINLPIEDYFGVPTNDQVDACLMFIESCQSPGNSVYVHCKAGRSRSAYIVVCYLMRNFQLPLEKAIVCVKCYRPQIVFNADRMRGLHNYRAHLLRLRLEQ